MGFRWRSKQVIEGTVTEQHDGSSSAVDVGSSHDAEADLREFKKSHKWDPFLDVDRLDAVENVIQSGDVEKQAAVEETLLEEDSPYAEVRTAVCSLSYLTRVFCEAN